MNIAVMLTILNVLVLGINVVVLGIGIKVYTEITKDKLQDKRKEAS